MNHGSTFLSEWSLARGLRRLAGNPLEQRLQSSPADAWCKSLLGWIKCNVDASFTGADDKWAWESAYEIWKVI